MTIPLFPDVHETLLDLDDKYDMSWSPKDGYIEVRIYVGIANTDLLKQAQQMFAPADEGTYDDIIELLEPVGWDR